MTSITFYKPAPVHECDLPFLYDRGAISNSVKYPIGMVAFCEECRQAWQVVEEWSEWDLARVRKWQKIDEIPDGYELSEGD